jgi:hypothetical protein
MISEIHISYGSCVRRHGKSLAFFEYHLSNVFVSEPDFLRCCKSRILSEPNPFCAIQRIKRV